MPPGTTSSFVSVAVPSVLLQRFDGRHRAGSLQLPAAVPTPRRGTTPGSCFGPGLALFLPASFLSRNPHTHHSITQPQTSPEPQARPARLPPTVTPPRERRPPLWDARVRPVSECPSRGQSPARPGHRSHRDGGGDVPPSPTARFLEVKNAAELSQRRCPTIKKLKLHLRRNKGDTI